MSASKDLAAIIKALQLVVEAQVSLQKESISHICRTSSLRPLIRECPKEVASSKSVDVTEFASSIRDGAARVNTVVHGVKVYADFVVGNAQEINTESILAQQFVVKPQRKPSNPNPTSFIPKAEYQIQLSPSDQKLLEKLDMEHRAKQQAEKKEETAPVATVPNPKAKLKLSEDAKQRKVPSSRLGRMVSFGSLAAGLGIGTATEYLKQTFKVGDVTSDGNNLFMSKANLERIVDTLCKVRGAALKLGQILSIQDESIISPDLAKALERVRKSADFMPDWQVDQVMSSQLGSNWLSHFAIFERRPFAAASIGQVHYGKLRDGREVAIKIQYPGVAKGIESDIDNLGGIMKMWNIFPQGMFLDNLMTVAKRELAWEVDYKRESQCTKKFKQILNDYDGYYVPDVIDELSTEQVFTTELLDGLSLDQCFDLDPEHRDIIGNKIMDLCLLEILRFKYMQTDPNWANFLYNPNRRQLMLLDFGASREYSKEFMDKYVQVLKGACDGDRNVVLNVSKEMGFLTGYESKLMEDAHVDAVMILGEIFRAEGKYDFANQNMTHRIQDLAQTMLVHRLCPPPEEVYSLHRKLSGVFLLLSKLKVKIECRQRFLALYEEYMRLNPAKV